METILLVDDEPMICRLLEAVLKTHGFTVLTAPNGPRAIEICAESGQQIDLLLTDIKMPGMDGRELARRLSVLQPEMKVLYMSGFADEIRNMAGNLTEGSEFLEKPFSNSMLMGRILVLLTKTKASPRKHRLLPYPAAPLPLEHRQRFSS